MDVDETLRKIKNIEIQGATAVARTGIKLLQELEEDGAGEDEVRAVAERLREARPTEPFLFNAIRIALETKEYAAVLDHIKEAQDAIRRTGTGLVEDGAVVYTHCHSSTVTGILKEAFEEKEFTVRVTETRPLYQGRRTAEELAGAGIPVEFYVDAGGRIALKDADIMLIGADAVTAEGAVINKIGSELFAEVANEKGVPVHVCTDSWKFDPRSVFGFSENRSVPEGNDCSNNGPSDRCGLERRTGEEVWPDAPDDVDIINYAFERVAPSLLSSIVSELGELPVHAFVEQAGDPHT